MVGIKNGKKKLKLEDSNNVFDKYKNDVDSVSKKDSKADIKKIEEIAKIQGFTKREQDQKTNPIILNNLMLSAKRVWVI